MGKFLHRRDSGFKTVCLKVYVKHLTKAFLDQFTLGGEASIIVPIIEHRPPTDSFPDHL